MKPIRCFLTVIVIFLTILSSSLATNIVVGTGTNINTSSSYPAPYGNFYWGAKHQFLITAAELNLAGMSAGNINNLSFVVDQANGVSLQSFTIAMKNTSTTNLTVFETGLTTVFSPVNYTEVNGLNTHVFGSPFYWDGVSSLLIETCFNNSAWTQNATTFYSNTSYSSSVYYRLDGPNVCASSVKTASVNNRPNMIFDWNPANVPPVTNFNANNLYSCSGIINFSDLSTNNPTSWYWEFGDGDTSTAQNPNHTYLSNGTYSVKLKTCNAFGCDSITFTNYITINLSAPVPIPASCTPNTQTYCCGFGITNVTFNTINNNSNDGVDGYSDFTCSQTNVLEGQTYLLSIQTMASSTQNYAAWIDFNNDGVFNNVTEKVFSSSMQMNASGNVTIPVGATLNTPLRLRVSADYDFIAPPTPCLNPTYGQTEDYTVIINSNPNPPTPIFSGSPTTTCSGTVCFTDLSLNVPTGWLWSFGDGFTSFQKNPCHTYAADGTYTIKLTVTNANGSNTDSIVNYITVNTAGQVLPATCSPITSAYCCAYGIYQVDFNTISNPSLDGIEGYKDFSCTNSTIVTEGQIYTLTVKTGVNNAQDTRVWIDFNNDGTFNNTNELIMDAPNTFNPTINYIIPSGSVLNTALRMRISSDIVGTAQNACDVNDFGQTEDYGVTILSNTSPPNTSYQASITSTCSDTICFTDFSSGLPTAWLWYFGDGATSTAQNPCHYYSSPGFYTVSLVTTNQFGQDSLAKINYININCSNVLMPTFGTNTITACNGTLYDDGGQFLNYSDNTNGITVIQPSGATMVSLNFSSFNFRINDSLIIYDGSSTASPIIASLTGNISPGVINSTSGSITLKQVSNNFQNATGFALNWSCIFTGIEEENIKQNDFVVYPNPTSGILNIESISDNQKGFDKIYIYNSIGQQVYSFSTSKKESKIQLNISNLDKGFYFLTIVSENGLITKKINLQ